MFYRHVDPSIIYVSLNLRNVRSGLANFQGIYFLWLKKFGNIHAAFLFEVVVSKIVSTF